MHCRELLACAGQSQLSCINPSGGGQDRVAGVFIVLHGGEESWYSGNPVCNKLKVKQISVNLDL